MKVLVTGAAGFVGSRLARVLLGRGDTVVGHDNFDPYYAREHKERHLRDLLPEERFTFVEGDLREAGHVLEVVQGATYVAAPMGFAPPLAAAFMARAG